MEKLKIFNKIGNGGFAINLSFVKQVDGEQKKKKKTKILQIKKDV